MPTTLLSGPPGDTTREPFFARVVAACRDPDEAIGRRYLVPTARRRADVEMALLATCTDGEAVCLPRVQTLDAFARELFSSESPCRLISWRTASMLIERILSDAPASFPSLMRGRSLPFPGLVDALVSMIRELKRYAREPEELARAAQGDHKARECAEVVRRYAELLATHGWADLQDAVLVAGRRLHDPAFRQHALAEVRTVVLDGFVEFSPAEAPLVSALGEAVDTTIILDRDPELKRLFAPLPSGLPPDAERAHESPFVGVARLALGCAAHGPCATVGNVAIIEAATREDEVECIAAEVKRLLLGGVAQHEIAVAVPDLDVYATLIEETFAEYALPCSIAAPMPLSESPVAAAVLRLVHTPERDFERIDLVGLLRSPFIAFRGDDTLAIAPVVDELARTMRIFRGKDAWCDGLRSRIAHLEQASREPATDYDDDEARGGTPESELARLRRVETVLPQVVESLDGLRRDRGLADHVRALRLLISRFGIEARCRDADAASPAQPGHMRFLEEVVRVLDELECFDRAAPGPTTISFEAFAEAVASALGSARVSPVVHPHGIEVLDIRGASSRRTKVLFCAGLVEGAVPVPPRRDPLLAPSIRAALRLPDAERLRADAWLDVYRALTSASDQIVLSRPTTDGETALLESPVFERIRCALALAPAPAPVGPTSRRELLSALGRRSVAVPTLDALLRSESFKDDASLHAHAHAAGVESLRAGATTAPSTYAGALSVRVLDEVRRAYSREHEYSATELERYVRCPFRFFAQWLLCLEEPEEPEEDIPARDKGTLLHRIFREFYARRLAERGESRIAHEELHAAFAQLVAAARRELDGEPYTGLLWEKFRERLIGAGDDVPGLLPRFLEVDVETTRGPSACTPRHLELGFGSQRHRQTLDPNSRREPIEIHVGERTIRLHGIIDRIDVNDAARTFCVLDYKSGGQVPSQSQVEKGTSLQLPIYMIAAQELLGEAMRFAAAGFFQTKDAANCAKSKMIGHMERAPDAVSRHWRKASLLDDAQLDDLLRREREAIGRAVEGIESGRFAVTTLGPDIAGCRACHYRHLCRYEGITIRTLQELQ